MNRPDLLSDAEQKIVDTHRAEVKIAQQKTAALSPDVRNELSSIYEDLVYTAPELLPERIGEITTRIHNLLY